MFKNVALLIVFTAVSSAVGAVVSVYATDYLRKRKAQSKVA